MPFMYIAVPVSIMSENLIFTVGFSDTCVSKDNNLLYFYNSFR